MYAIIQTGGKQYKVKAGDLVRVEKLDGEPGIELVLTDILMVGGEKTFLGQPMVKDAKVTVVVTNQAKAAKIIVFKKKRRQGYRRTQGHRQMFTELFIKTITSPEGEVSKASSEAPVVDHEKREANKEKRAMILAEKGVDAKPAKKAAAPKATKKAAAKAKKPAKKAAAKKAPAKKAKAAATTKKKTTGKKA